MVLHLPATIVPRARRGLVLLIPVVLAMTVAGCGHKRSAMRPVYMAPAPAAVAVPAPAPVPVPKDCPPGGEPGIDPSATPTTIEPAVPPLDAPAGPAPAAPSAPVTPPRPGIPDEPTLELNPANGEKPPTAAPGPANPGASLRDGLRSPSGRLRQASLLQENLRPFVSDADDLFHPPKADRPWKYVVLHHSANPSGGYDQIDRDHRKVLGWEGCGYHFVIGNGTGSPDGRIEIAQRWVNQKHGVHCQNGKTPEINEYGIGICLVGDLDKNPPTRKQIEATRALVAYLSTRYSIPTQRVGTHAALANSPTACPGKHFPAQAILGSRNLVSR